MHLSSDVDTSKARFSSGRRLHASQGLEHMQVILWREQWLIYLTPSVLSQRLSTSLKLRPRTSHVFILAIWHGNISGCSLHTSLPFKIEVEKHYLISASWLRVIVVNIKYWVVLYYKVVLALGSSQCEPSCLTSLTGAVGPHAFKIVGTSFWRRFLAFLLYLILLPPLFIFDECVCVCSCVCVCVVSMWTHVCMWRT